MKQFSPEEVYSLLSEKESQATYLNNVTKHKSFMPKCVEAMVSATKIQKGNWPKWYDGVLQFALNNKINKHW